MCSAQGWYFLWYTEPKSRQRGQQWTYNWGQVIIKGHEFSHRSSFWRIFRKVSLSITGFYWHCSQLRWYTNSGHVCGGSLQLVLWLLIHSYRQRKRSEPPPPLRRPGRSSDGHCPVHPPHPLSNSSVELGSPNLATHCSPRALLQNRNLNADSPERRRRPGHGSLTNISRHDSLKKIDSPPIRRSTSSGQYTGFNDHKPLDPESIAQVCTFFSPLTLLLTGADLSEQHSVGGGGVYTSMSVQENILLSFLNSACEGKRVKRSWWRSTRGIDVAQAIKRDNFLLHHNEIASATHSARMINDCNGYVSLCALKKASLI